jgi:Dehydrogenases (flavoproteins)
VSFTVCFGWANYSKVKELCKLIDIDSDNYVLVRPKKAIVNGIDFKIRDVVIFDKPRFINDLRNQINVVYEVPENYSGDLIVDATGHSRALLRGVDIKYLVTKQYRVKVSELDPNCIYIYAKPFGYAWAFPLSDIEWHIGAGGFTREQVDFLIRNLNKTYEIKFNDIECACKSPIIWDYGISFLSEYTAITLLVLVKQVVLSLLSVKGILWLLKPPNVCMKPFSKEKTIQRKL